MARLETAASIARLRARADAGEAEAQNHLGILHREGLRAGDAWLVRKDLRQSRRYFERAAALGHPDAMTEVADALSNADPASVDAERLYERAFAAGYSLAAHNLACTYQARGDMAGAIRWFRRGAAARDPSCELELIRAQLHGLDGRSRHAKALAALRALGARRALPGWVRAEAMTLLARCYLEGWVAPRNVREARRLLRRATALGDAVAAGMLEVLGP